MKCQAALFIDRDGTLIEEVHYLTDERRIRILPGAFEAIRRANRAALPVVVVTNQSAIARGLLSLAELEVIHKRIRTLFEREGATLDAFYYCPHHPQEGYAPFLEKCSCRKPKPGLLLQASRDLRLEPRRSVMIGDTLADVEAGHRAGATSVLVETGYGAEIAARLTSTREPLDPCSYPDYIASDILQAVDWSLEKIRERASD